MRRNGSLPAFWRRCTYEGSDLFYRGPGEISPQEYGAYDRRETTCDRTYKEYGLKLAFEPRAAGEHGKPFLTLQPKIHYNISHSGKYVMCIIAGEEVGIDVQEHKKVNYERMLTRMVPADMVREILESEQMEKAFFYPVGAQRSLHQMDGRRSFQRPPQDLPGQRQLPDA